MNDDFDIRAVEEGTRRTVLRVHGELDAGSSPLLVERCTRERAAGRSVILNLSGVTFIASSGVGALLALVEEFRETPASLHLVSPSAPVVSVIRLLGLDQFLPINPSEEAARAALGG